MNDLLRRTEKGKQRSRIIKLIVTTTWSDNVITLLCEGVVPTRSEWNTLVNNVFNYTEFCRWRSLCLMYKRLDMFLSVVTKPQLCIWWLIAQRNINIANSCKVMFKLLCCEKASML